MTHEAGNAPITELRLAAAIHTYERIKLGLLVMVLLLDLAIGGYQITISQTNQALLSKAKSSLVILQCAVNKSTYQDPNGKPLTQADSRTAFQACVAAGGPKVR